jgi:hypothetical protein
MRHGLKGWLLGLALVASCSGAPDADIAFRGGLPEAGAPEGEIGDGGAIPLDAESALTDARDDGPAPPACPAGTTNANLVLASDVQYPAGHLASNPARYPLGPICLPFTEAGQAYYLESKVTRADCNVYDACETSLEIKCFDPAGTQLHPQLWSAENYLNGAPASNLFARMLFRAARPGAVTCRVQFFNHDHGVAGGTITVAAGSSFTASGPLDGTAATADTGGGAHLTVAKPQAALKAIRGFRMPAGRNNLDYIGDIQVTECHVPYPANANDPATECTTSEAGADSVVQYRAEAYEENADGTTCQVTEGTTRTATVDERTHHKMLYTQVLASHTAGCANVWHFQIDTRWTSGRSFMVQSGPYGQGIVRSRP